MLVKDLMQKAVFTVGPEDPIDRVFFLLHYEKIRHLPVVEGKQVVGIVSDRDLYKALGPKSRRGTIEAGNEAATLVVMPKKVRHIMRRGVITILPEASVAEAAEVMASRKIGALPVVKNAKLIGILTATDVLKAFVTVYHRAFRCP